VTGLVVGVVVVVSGVVVVFEVVAVWAPDASETTDLTVDSTVETTDSTTGAVTFGSASPAERARRCPRTA